MRHIYNPVKVTTELARKIEARILLSGLRMRNTYGSVKITGTEYTGIFFLHSDKWSEKCEDSTYITAALHGNPACDFSHLNKRLPLQVAREVGINAIIELMIELRIRREIGVRLVEHDVIIENMEHLNSMLFFQIHDEDYTYNTYVPHAAVNKYIRKHMNKPQPDTLGITLVEWPKHYRW